MATCAAAEQTWAKAASTKTQSIQDQRATRHLVPGQSRCRLALPTTAALVRISHSTEGPDRRAGHRCPGKFLNAPPSVVRQSKLGT